MDAQKLSNRLDSGWKGITQPSSFGPQYYVGEDESHYITVTLPDGISVAFAPEILNYDNTGYIFNDPGAETIIRYKFQPFEANQGSLLIGGNEIGEFTSSTENLDREYWNDLSLAFEPVDQTQLKYVTPDGTIYAFEQQGSDSLTLLLTTITDRNGNSLAYAYDSSTPPQLTSIQHSSGRKVTLDYSVTGEIQVFDTAGHNGKPVIRYVFDGNKSHLMAVKRLVNPEILDDTAYETTKYEYGNTDAPADSAHTSANADRITDIFDARGVRVLHNQYWPGTPPSGDLLSQTDVANHTTSYNYDDATGKLDVIRTTSTGTRSMEVTHDASGAISGVTEPVNGSIPPSTLAMQNTYDGQGRLIAQTDANGKTKTFEYDDKDRLIGQSDAAGNGTSVELNDAGQPTISSDAKGNETLYQYDNQGNPTSVRDPSGTSTDYTYYDSIPKLLASESQAAPFVPYKTVTEYTYQTTGLGVKGDLIQTIQKWVDSKGVTIGAPVRTAFEYDENGNRLAEIKARTITTGVSSVTEFTRTEYTYDAQNRVTDTKVQTGSSSTGPWTDVPNTHTHTTYDKNGKQVESTDGYNRVTTSVYDFTGSLIETIYPDHTVSRTCYDEFGRQQYVQERAMTNSLGETTAPATWNNYDASGRVTNVARISSVTLTKEDANGATVMAAGVDYITLGLASDEEQVKMVPSAPGSVLSSTFTFYDAVGRVRYSVDARDNVTENIYDDAGRRTGVRLYTSYHYNRTTGGIPAPTAGATFQQTTYTYDANGNQVTVTDNASHATTSVYDAANRVVEVQFPETAGNGPRSRFTYYDGLGRKILETDEAGVSTSYTYDFRGLLTSVTLAAGTTQPATTVYQYDELGNLIKQTDAQNHSTTFTYDVLGRRTSRTLPGVTVPETVVYDATPKTPGSSINVAWQDIKDFNDLHTYVTNDIMDRVVGKGLPATTGFPAVTVSFAYNPTNGQRAQVVQSPLGGASRTVHYAYDKLGRLRVKNTPEGTLTYTYEDATGALLDISAKYSYYSNNWPAMPAGGYFYDATWEISPVRTLANNPNGAEWKYKYDQLGRLQKVNPDPAGNGADATYTYNPVGNLETTTYRNGVVNTYNYNERNWLRMVDTKNSVGAQVAQFDYDNAATGGAAWTNDRRLSPVGQRNRVAEWVNGVSRTVDYDYDVFRRLTKENIISVTGPAGMVRYDTVSAGSTAQGYDSVGNRRSRKVVSGVLPGVTDYEANTFDARDLLNAGSGYTYDANGNTLADGSGATDFYDAENRLVKRTRSGSSDILISYDADGNRVSKTAGGTTTYYLVEDRNPSGYAQVMEERTALTGDPVVSYVYGLSLISQKRGSVVRYYGCDGLGSVSYLTDGTIGSATYGKVTDTYTYDAFGILIAQTSPGGSPTLNNYLYTGQQWDPHLNLYYLRARYLNPTTGRFWTIDTFQGRQSDPLSLHKYLYAQANPINGIDPSGFDTVLVVRDGGGIGSGGTAKSAARHLENAGWTVKYMTSIEFGEITGRNPDDPNDPDQHFQGIIMAGHGDATESGGVQRIQLENILHFSHDKMRVLMALSCHGNEFVAPLIQGGFTASDSLIISYKGYNYNDGPIVYRIGYAIDKWAQNPIYTEILEGKLIADGAGIVGHEIVSGVGCFLTMLTAGWIGW